MKSRLLVKLLLAAVALAAGAFYLISSLKPSVEVATVVRSVAVQSVPGTIEVMAAKEMSIRGDLQGRVKESRLELGATVSEGDLLVSLDLGDLEIQMEKVLLEIEAAELILKQGSRRRFELVTLEERVAETERRFEAGIASKSELDARRRDLTEIEQGIEAELNAQQLRIEQHRNALKLLERNKEKMSIRAPLDGVITKVWAYRGDLIGGGQEIAKMISLERIVAVKVSEENFSGIELGQIARVKFLGYGAAMFDAKVSKTLPVADPQTQRYTIHLEVDIPTEKLFPGLTGEATITLNEREKALIIPGAAIIGNQVFVVQDGVVSMRRVVKGYGSLTSVEIVSGLEEGEQVVVDSLDLIKVGDRVRISARGF